MPVDTLYQYLLHRNPFAFQISQTQLDCFYFHLIIKSICEKVRQCVLAAIPEGCHVHAEICATPSEFWKYMEEKIVDILITDIEMPEMNGMELGTKIRSFQISPPIIQFFFYFRPSCSANCQLFSVIHPNCCFPYSTIMIIVTICSWVIQRSQLVLKFEIIGNYFIFVAVMDYLLNINR